MEGRSFSGRERNCCFLNTGQERFATISALSGLDFPDDGRSIAVTDWDLDGDQDLWISNRNAPRLRFLRNDTPSRNQFVSLKLAGNGSTTNRDAIGARVEVFAQPEARLVQTLRAGEGFLSQSSKRLHFGLGAATSIERVIVHWPGGNLQTFVGLRPNRHYLLTQDEVDPLPLDENSKPVTLAASEQVLPAPTQTARIALVTRVPMPSLTYTSPDGTRIIERFESASPTLVNLWASWCSPCVEELTEFTAKQRQLENAGVKVVSLSVDQLGAQPTSVDEVVKLIRRLDYPYPWGYLNEQQMDLLQELHNQFFFLRRPLPLPSSLLVDDHGRLSVIYRGAVSVEQLLEDAARPAGGYLESSRDAACLPGQPLNHARVQAVARRADLQLRYRVAAWLEESGRYRDALSHFEELARFDPSWALPLRHLAKLYLNENQGTKAAEYGQRALELDPRNARIQNTMGLVHSGLGDSAQAIACLQEAIRLDPRFAEAHNNLGTILAGQGQLEAAGRCFAQAVKIDDNFAEAHTNLGSVYAARDDLPRAISQYERAIEIDPTYVDAHSNLGTMFARQGNLAQAIKHYRNALKLDPENANARGNLDHALNLLNSQSRPRP